MVTLPPLLKVHPYPIEKIHLSMTWNSIMGLISSIALFLPAGLIIMMRLSAYKTFPALMLYYFSVFSYNLLTEGYIKANNDVISYWGMTSNLLDAPLMLFFLTYFSASNEFTKRMKQLILLQLIFATALIVMRGFNVKSVTIIMAPGLLTVFCFCLYFFIRQTKITIMHRKATGKALIAASLLFAYGCYSIIYLMYYIFKTPHVADTFLVYFLVTTFSSLLMCLGIIIERKRVQKLEELKQTRRELSIVYREANKAISLKTASIEKDRFN
jgi:hypothetical protein